ncbi:MAG: hypothetical protein Q9188_001672 [Gyalolechia gomerana]
MFSRTYLSHLVKRKRTRGYDAAVCKGGTLYKRIQAAFEGTIPPGPQSSQQDIANGWTNIGDQDSLVVDEDWDEIFIKIGGRVPAESEVIISHLNQWRAFKNTNGDLVTHSIRSATSPPSPPSSRSTREVPNTRSNSASETRKCRLSDVMWTVWNTVSKSPNEIRYIGHNDIINEDTHGIMDDIFTRGEAKKPIGWPGLTFRIDTKEGQSLLATPNGVGVGTAWFLIDRAGKLGRRIPTITVFSPTGFAFPYALGFASFDTYFVDYPRAADVETRVNVMILVEITGGADNRSWCKI